MPLEYRSSEIEWMDDLTLDSAQLTLTLHEIAMINRYLGGHRSVKTGLRNILGRLGFRAGEKVRIIDVGCGIGDCLHAISASFGHKYSLDLTGLDANPGIISRARAADRNDRTAFMAKEIAPENIGDLEADVLIFSLFLHHFSDDHINSLISSIDPGKVKAVLINDLQRNLIALFLYRIVTFVFRLNPMARNDGAISIRKGFKKRELSELLEKLSHRFLSVKPVWAFRYRAEVIL